jgi:phosphomannomutase/phosphoglucomutase
MDGTFPGRLPEPSPEGLKGLAKMVVSTGSAFSIAHDGDADRAVFIDENGRFIEENQEFALVAKHICHKKKGTVVTPVSTSHLVEMVVKNEGGSVTYTPVGSIYVARTMRSLIEKGEDVVFGGEGNGGLIFPDHQFCRDGGMTAAMMVFIHTSNRKPLSKLINELPERFLIKDKISTPHGVNLLEYLKMVYSKEKIDQTDGLKIFRNTSWVLVRASGTEPIIRILIDAEDRKSGEIFYKDLMNHISEITNKLKLARSI